MKREPSDTMLIEAALSGNFHDVVERFCDGNWERLPGLWRVPFEDVVRAAKGQGLARFVTAAPRSEGYWLIKTETGFRTLYFERGICSDVVEFAELEPAFRHWLRCYLGTYRITVSDRHLMGDRSDRDRSTLGRRNG